MVLGFWVSEKGLGFRVLNCVVVLAPFKISMNRHIYKSQKGDLKVKVSRTCHIGLGFWAMLMLEFAALRLESLNPKS